MEKSVGVGAKKGVAPALQGAASLQSDQTGSQPWGVTDEGIKSQALGSPEEKHLIEFGVSERFLEGVERELGPEQRSEEELETGRGGER